MLSSSFTFYCLSILPPILPLILSIAFLTLLERKVLASSHLRKGPNKVGPWGLGQAFADGFKLIAKISL